MFRSPLTDPNDNLSISFDPLQIFCDLSPRAKLGFCTYIKGLVELIAAWLHAFMGRDSFVESDPLTVSPSQLSDSSGRLLWGSVTEKDCGHFMSWTVLKQKTEFDRRLCGYAREITTSLKCTNLIEE